VRHVNLDRYHQLKKTYNVIILSDHFEKLYNDTYVISYKNPVLMKNNMEIKFGNKFYIKNMDIISGIIDVGTEGISKDVQACFGKISELGWSVKRNRYVPYTCPDEYRNAPALGSFKNYKRLCAPNDVYSLTTDYCVITSLQSVLDAFNSDKINSNIFPLLYDVEKYNNTNMNSDFIKYIIDTYERNSNVILIIPPNITYDTDNTHLYAAQLNRKKIKMYFVSYDNLDEKYNELINLTVSQVYIIKNTYSTGYIYFILSGLISVIQNKKIELFAPVTNKINEYLISSNAQYEITYVSSSNIDVNAYDLNINVYIPTLKKTYTFDDKIISKYEYGLNRGLLYLSIATNFDSSNTYMYLISPIKIQSYMTYVFNDYNVSYVIANVRESKIDITIYNYDNSTNGTYNFVTNISENLSIYSHDLSYDSIVTFNNYDNDYKFAIVNIANIYKNIGFVNTKITFSQEIQSLITFRLQKNMLFFETIGNLIDDTLDISTCDNVYFQNCVFGLTSISVFFIFFVSVVCKKYKCDKNEKICCFIFFAIVQLCCFGILLYLTISGTVYMIPSIRLNVVTYSVLTISMTIIGMAILLLLIYCFLKHCF